MTFAVRPMGLGLVKSLDLVGVGTLSTGSTIAFPSTAQAGDLAVVMGSSTGGGTTPSGWSKVHADSSRDAYKVCAGGETSVTSPYSGGSFRVFLLRPSGGAASLADSRSGAAGTALSSMTPSGSAYLISNCLSTTVAGVSFAAPSYPSGGTVQTNVGSPNPLLLYTVPIDAGVATGSLNFTCTTSPNRQTHGLFQVT